jgi:SAM-dependent methyltransferase
MTNLEAKIEPEIKTESGRVGVAATRKARGLVQRFVDANRRASRRVAARLPHSRQSLGDRYDRTVANHMGEGQRIIDVGGGKRCSFSEYRSAGTWLVAVDLTEDAMTGNTDVDERVVADVVADDLPFEDASVDIICSRSVLEHLADVDSFARHSARVLKPGGYSIHLFPGRRSVFAMINRALPHWLARKLLFSLRPSQIGIGGFPVVYHRCTLSEMKDTFLKSDHDVVAVVASYHGSQYFEFLFPLYLVVTAYEYICSVLSLKDQAARYLVVARRR